MNNLKPVVLALILSLGLQGSAQGAATRFTSPNYGVESIIFGGTGTLRSAISTVPPKILSGPSVSSVLTESVTIKWTTDKPTNSLVMMGTQSGTYTIQTGKLDSATVTQHEVTVSQLEKGTTYFYKVRSMDVAGNAVESTELSFRTDLGDVTPPRIVSGPFISNNSPTSMILTWETDELAGTTVEYGTSSVDEKINGRPDELTLFHQFEISGLRPEQAYLVRVKSRDAAGNLQTGETLRSTTLRQTTITDVKVSGITLESALVEWNTTIPTTSQISYGLSQAYDRSYEDASMAEKHVARLSGLQSGSTYYFRIRGQDQAANIVSSDEYLFKTVVLPTIGEVTVSEITSHGALVSWISSSPIDELTRYEISSSTDTALIGKKFTTGNDQSVTSHTLTLSDLEAGSEYRLTASGKDLFGNQAISLPVSFTTLNDGDPPLIQNVKIDTSVDLGSKQSVQVLVSFGLSEPGIAVLDYGAGANGPYGQVVKTDTEISQNKFMVIPGLRPGESYHFRIVAKDKSGNEATSADYLVLAPSQPVSLFDLIFNQIRLNFGWLSNL
ncbi:MAG: hypothetical protein K0S20_46 [Patescibacteria group bacterium]|jgi:hypothetical protein|nr:hypothetical protein [Patescibacteria group bacterium]